MLLSKVTLAKVLALTGFSMFTLPALAQDCSVTVDSNDAMQFDSDSIEISKSCDEFTVTLTHSGELPVSSMGHNWVLSEEEDMQAIARDGTSAGVDQDYLQPDDDRVIAATDMIGGGGETSTTFDVSQLEEGGSYMFFCSFPGHLSMMQGSVTLVP
ncbi:MAG: azurin [Pseudomonadales bacterium]